MWLGVTVLYCQDHTITVKASNQYSYMHELYCIEIQYPHMHNKNVFYCPKGSHIFLARQGHLTVRCVCVMKLAEAQAINSQENDYTPHYCC